MRNYTYNFEIEDLIAQFINAFNDVIINRYNKEREIEDRIHVNFVYAPKKRALYDIINKNPNPASLPVIAVYITNIARDNSRVENKMGKSYFVNDTKDIKERRQPVPVKIDIGMSVLTKSTQDLLQIMSNWVPYTDPYIYIDVEDPSTGQIIRTKVRWNENITIDQELDDPSSKVPRSGFDTSFTIEGYLFKKLLPDSSRICKITTNMSSVSCLTNCFMSIEAFENEINLNPDNKETFIVEGISRLYCITPWETIPGKSKYEFKVSGKNLNYVTSLYVSANTSMFPTSAVNHYNFFPDTSANVVTNYCTENPETSTQITSARCRPFYGVEVSAFEYTPTGNALLFNLPYVPTTTGIFDVIAVTTCGCSKLSIDSKSLSTEFYTTPTALSGGVIVSIPSSAYLLYLTDEDGLVLVDEFGIPLTD